MNQKIHGTHTGIPNRTHITAVKNPSDGARLIHTTVYIGDEEFNAYGDDSAILISEATVRRIPLQLAYWRDDEKGNVIIDSLIAPGLRE